MHFPAVIDHTAALEHNSRFESEVSLWRRPSEAAQGSRDKVIQALRSMLADTFSGVDSSWRFATDLVAYGGPVPRVRAPRGEFKFLCSGGTIDSSRVIHLPETWCFRKTESRRDC
jgi:hypothetical protein